MAKYVIRHVSLVLSIYLQMAPTYAKVSTGIIQTAADWTFLDRFCFVSEVGKLQYDFKYPMRYGVEKLYLYYDSETQWPAIYKTSKTCEQKESVLKRDNYQIVNLSNLAVDDYSWPGCEVISDRPEPYFHCFGYRRFSSWRERWWYLALGNCNTSQGLYMEYKLWMTNGLPGDVWHYHFSADEFYILPVNIGFLVVEGLTLVISTAIAFVLKSRQMLHSTYKMYVCCVFLECTSLLFYCIAYAGYALNGIGWPFLKLLGQLCRASSSLVFLLLLILMAKGYTITRGRLSKKGQVRITIFMSVYTFVYASCFIYQSKFFDPGEVTYFYESPAGYGLVVLRFVGWLWFCYAIYFTLVHYPEKRIFYVTFATVFTLWFWISPVIIILANTLIGKWIREKLVNGVNNAAVFMGFVVFLFITRPSAANRNFPYHCRTTQIKALNAKEDEDTAVNLPHNTYAPNSYDIFTVGAYQETTNDPFALRRHTAAVLDTPETNSTPLEPFEPLESPSYRHGKPPTYAELYGPSSSTTPLPLRPAPSAPLPPIREKLGSVPEVEE